MYNLLTQPAIAIGSAQANQRGFQRETLPGVFAHLLNEQPGEFTVFPAMRPYQRHAWHSFLAQLGAMAMERSGLVDIPDDASVWESLLRNLSGGDDTPWHLVQGDIRLAAFLQSPALEDEQEDDYRFGIETPDKLDLLVTSKNHDIKANMARRMARLDDWIFALVSLQTMEGFAGAGNYGISRMNSGMGNRPCFTLEPEGGAGRQLRRDIELLMRNRHALTSGMPYSLAGETLLWTLPWDGTVDDMLQPSELHPLYIEVCRRIRLQQRSERRGDIRAVRATSRAPRIDAKTLKGMTGDPWTPVSVKDSKSLTVAGGGLGYRRVMDWLDSEKWTLPMMMEADHYGPAQLIIRALVRGSGKTEGYHERIIPIRDGMAKVLTRFRDDETVAAIVEDRMKKISTIQRILSHAVQVYVARGESSNLSQEHRRIARPYVSKLNDIIDGSFFEHLQDEIEAEGDEARAAINKEWQVWLIDQARIVLGLAVSGIPSSSAFRERALQNCRSLYESRVRGPQGFPQAFEKPETEEDGDESQEEPAESEGEPVAEPEGETGETAQVPERELPPWEVRNRQWYRDGVGVAITLAGWRTSRGDLAQLRRMDPDNPDVEAYWRLMAERELMGDRDAESDWGYLVKSIALMTRNTGNEWSKMAHDSKVSIGRMLCTGGDDVRRNPMFSETRLKRLLSSDGRALRDQLMRICRSLGNSGRSWNIGEMTVLVLSEKADPITHRRHLRRISRDYYQALRYMSRAASNDSEPGAKSGSGA